MPSKQLYAIAGMHRGGTSLFASFIMECGLNFGNNLMPPDKGNPNGYFEDLDIVNFHKSLLRKNGTGYWIKDHKKELQVDKLDLVQANKILEEKFLNTDNYCFKDPRTSLFLDMWNRADVLNKKFIMIIRNPILVMNSIYRRNTDRIHTDPFFPLRNYYYYNKSILNFTETNLYTDILVIDIDSFVSNPEAYIAELNSFVASADITIDKFLELYRPKQLKNNNKDRLLLTNISMLFNTKLMRSASDIYETLKQKDKCSKL